MYTGVINLNRFQLILQMILFQFLNIGQDKLAVKKPTQH